MMFRKSHLPRSRVLFFAAPRRQAVALERAAESRLCTAPAHGLETRATMAAVLRHLAMSCAVLLLLSGCQGPDDTSARAAPTTSRSPLQTSGGSAKSQVRSTADAPRWTDTYLLHIPGIGGHLAIDDHLLAGLRQAKAADEFELYDWTGPDRGVIALGSVPRHEQQSQLIADALAHRIRANPRERIILTAHSAGAGIAVFALERLPDDLKIDTLVMMQAALSPGYDLSAALRHVRGRAYSFYSPLDPVLGAGTRLMGTVDRVQTDAAGRVGFVAPPPPKARDPKQYEKLTQFEYRDSWTRYDDIGDHIGPMTTPFAREMLAPLLRTGQLPE